MKYARLKNKIHLSHRVAVYVPSTTNVNQSTDNAMQVERVLSTLSNLFGGATASDALGCWLSPGAGLVRERVTICYAYCNDTQLKDGLDAVVDLCEALRDEMAQDAIALEVNGEMCFI